MFVVFTSASRSIIAFRLHSYLELDYTFGFIFYMDICFIHFQPSFHMSPIRIFSVVSFYAHKFIAIRQMIDSGS